jgi:adenosylmethionine-8-amino-7-oxononanoate aminotransferase
MARRARRRISGSWSAGHADRRFAPEQQVGARIHAEAAALALFSRVRGDVFLLAPPFVTSDDVLDQIGGILAAAARSVFARLTHP